MSPPWQPRPPHTTWQGQLPSRQPHCPEVFLISFLRGWSAHKLPAGQRAGAHNLLTQQRPPGPPIPLQPSWFHQQPDPPQSGPTGLLTKALRPLGQPSSASPFCEQILLTHPALAPPLEDPHLWSLPLHGDLTYPVSEGVGLFGTFYVSPRWLVC